MKDILRERLLESLLTEKDNRKVLINKLGVSEEIANWAHGLSDKLSTWIVSSLKVKYSSDMEGISDEDRVSLDNYFMGLDGDYKEIIGLLQKKNRPKLNIKELTFVGALEFVGRYSHIEAWLDDPATDIQAERGHGFLQNMSWDDALVMANEWHASLMAGGSVEDLLDDKDEIIHTFENGFQWILRRSNKCPKSRESMGHCATASKSDMYLLRLVKDSAEYVTVDWHPTKKVTVQIKGKGNKKPIDKFHPYIVWLIQNKEWGGIEVLKTDSGYLPNTNFHLGELNPELAASIYGANPDIMNIHSMLKYTPNNNKDGLITNLFKYESFVNKLIPYGFSKFFEMVENKDSVNGIIIKNPTFLEKMNRYRGVLTYTMEEMINASNYKDKLIEALLNKEGLINLLDEDGVELLISNHSDPDKIRDIIMQSEFEDEEEEEMAEMTLRETIVRELKRKFHN